MNKNNEVQETLDDKKYYVTRDAITAYKSNPWAEDLVDVMVTRNKTTGFVSAKNLGVIDHDTGAIDEHSHVVMGVRQKVDKEEFVKVFEKAIYGIFQLSKSAQSVYEKVLLAYLAQKNSPQQIYITFLLFKEDLEYKKSKTTFNSGLNELCLNNFLAPVADRPNMYWVNPTLFYKGDRIRIVHEFIKEKRDEPSPLELTLKNEDKTNE